MDTQGTASAVPPRIFYFVCGEATPKFVGTEKRETLYPNEKVSKFPREASRVCFEAISCFGLLCPVLPDFGLPVFCLFPPSFMTHCIPSQVRYDYRIHVNES